MGLPGDPLAPRRRAAGAAAAAGGMVMLEEGKSCYDALGVGREATQAEIRKAYLTLAVTCHPDKHPSDEQATTRFQTLQKIYGILSDAEKCVCSAGCMSGVHAAVRVRRRCQLESRRTCCRSRRPVSCLLCVPRCVVCFLAGARCMTQLAPLTMPRSCQGSSSMRCMSTTGAFLPRCAACFAQPSRCCPLALALGLQTRARPAVPSSSGLLTASTPGNFRKTTREQQNHPP